ncbi:MAG TPA: DUF2116 family Zn-ribbon domain-containing protein [Candidatus Nitrosotenuis sp.]|nr:DUF2116 family Zn-ribbon domain-containing protein [Candidatus Nitrosotenuis sp.]
MQKECKRCGNSFEGCSEFCSDQCKEEYLVDLKKKLDLAVKKDTGHTKKMSGC